MDLLTLLDRCVSLELGASEIYTRLATRFAGDAELRALWLAMADDERGHALKLATWRAIVGAEPAEHRATASGFVEAVESVERLVARFRDEAPRCASADDAFALALALETSELDALYTRLLESLPLARFPDLAATVRRETAAHHGALLRVVRARSTDERTLLRAALLQQQE